MLLGWLVFGERVSLFTLAGAALIVAGCILAARRPEACRARASKRRHRRDMMAWFWLILGGLFEVGFTTSLRFVDGFRNLPWTLAFLVSVTISMGLLEYAARTIPMGTAYAVWGGIGAVGTVIVGMAFFDEPTTTIRLLLILRHRRRDRRAQAYRLTGSQQRRDLGAVLDRAPEIGPGSGPRACS